MSRESCFIYMYGLFQMFRSRDQLRKLMTERQVRRRKRFRKAAAFILALLSSRPPRRKLWTRSRSTDWWERVVLGSFSHLQWLEHFRMNRNTFHVLCAKLGPLLYRKQTHLRPCIPLEKRVAVALLYLASGTDFRTLSELFGIGKSTVHLCVWEVCGAIRTLQNHFIRLPKAEKLQEVIHGFEERWRFPQCAGVVDGVHIPITRPRHNAIDYYNHRGTYSIILQAVVDHMSRFTNINVGWAGSVPDAQVLRNSTLFKLADSGDFFPSDTREIEGTQVPIMLLGDPKYPLLNWLMKGFPENEHLTREERKFNARLSRARTSAEFAFGQLKGRWRCLLKKMEVSISMAPTVVSSCCVLHNLCALHGDDVLDAWMQETEEPPEPNPPAVPVDLDRAEQTLDVRRALVRHFSSAEA